MKHKFTILWLTGIASAAAVLPYAFALQHEVIAKVAKPLPVIIFASIAQTAILLGIATFFGLKLSRNLHLPVLELDKNKLSSFLRLTVSAGIGTGIAIVAGDKIFGRYIPQLTTTNGQIALWKTLLAALYGGTAEELLLRLFCLSLFAWIIAKIARNAEPAKNNLIMWTAIILSSVLFGLGHLPITAALTAITPIVIVRAIVLNGIGGLVFGWLYWKRGLEYAMAAHFTADIVLLAILPALLK